MKSTKSLSWIRKLFAGGPVRVPPDVFEISDRVLRYAKFETSGGSLENTRFEEVTLPEEVFQEGPLGGPVRDREAFDRAMEVLLSAASEVDRGSLLLPDRWLRTIRIDAEGVGDVGSEEEFLQWRLKKLVPFRVEDLRVRSMPESVSREKPRVVVGFAVDQLLSELEDAFAQHGIRLGVITNRSQPIAGALNALDELRCIAVLGEEGYSLVFVESGRVVLARYKTLNPSRLGNGLETLVRRDLRITKAYLEDEFPDRPLSRSLVCGPPETEEVWTTFLEDCLGVPSLKLGPADLRPATSGGQPWHVMAPLLGAAGLELS